MAEPRKPHLMAARNILKYVKTTSDMGFFYRIGMSFVLQGYSDADYGGDSDDRKSTSGYVFTCGSASISWCNKNSLKSSPHSFLRAIGCLALKHRREGGGDGEVGRRRIEDGGAAGQRKWLTTCKPSSIGSKALVRGRKAIGIGENFPRVLSPYDMNIFPPFLLSFTNHPNMDAIVLISTLCFLHTIFVVTGDSIAGSKSATGEGVSLVVSRDTTQHTAWIGRARRACLALEKP
ncbi:hypothetical protein KSP39_PZI010942 [Platanthera zijinensis]|uniref:Uncharacterized protein n=1 Tax=Platanthera zijinensis TaxID=2320716 RepID=A0AAP0BHU4_9ASPA